MEQLEARALGRPTGRVEVDTPDIDADNFDPVKLTREQRQAILREYRRRGGQLSVLKLLPGGEAEESAAGQ
jgi:hypothetical protein